MRLAPRLLLAAALLLPALAAATNRSVMSGRAAYSYGCT